MTPDELANALESLGYSPEFARRPIPEIREGENAQGGEYHLVHRNDGRISVETPDDRSNKTRVAWLGAGPAVFDTADEARRAVFELARRTKEIYG